MNVEFESSRVELRRLNVKHPGMLISLPFFTPDQRRSVVPASGLQPLVGRLFLVMDGCASKDSSSPSEFPMTPMNILLQMVIAHNFENELQLRPHFLKG
jgi:hypothetical protein